MKKNKTNLVPVPNSKMNVLGTGTRSAFTLIELTITITILVILAAIWFTSYSWYIKWVRDTNRVSQLEAISNGLDLYKIKYNLPLPDDYVQVKANSEIIAYQWYVWKSVLQQIEYSKEWLDPKINTYFTYYISKDRKKHQLIAFLEESDSFETSFLINNKTNAVDYSSNYPYVYWDKLWILTDENNTPIQEIADIITNTEIDLWWTNSWTLYISYIDNAKKYSFSWSILEEKLYTLSVWWIYSAPNNCPEWFIAVPWNKTFSQAWFCVAKYEMSFAWLTDTDWTDQNSYSYLDNWDQWTVVSAKWNSPIAEITQAEAITECTDLWKWYHLITENQWMTIARNIELESVNWSSLIVWNWWIFTGISNNTTLWCSWTWTTYLPSATAYGSTTWHNICNWKNKLTLSNSQEIWDFAWNVWEHVNKSNTINWTDNDLWQTTIWWSTNWTWWDDDWVYTLTDMDLYGSIFHYWISKGMWNLFYSNWVATNVFVRWWSWSDWLNWWIYLLVLWFNNTNNTYATGFRCAKTR